ncbi:MAG: hypothetical protein WC553_02675 [Patescibacteria group bacterium]|jgi:hypothetical protein
MFTTYLSLYGLLTLVGAVEIFTGFLKPCLGLGIHVFLSLFAIVFLAQFIELFRQRAVDDETKNKTVYRTNRLTLILATLLLLMAWLFSV